MLPRWLKLAPSQTNLQDKARQGQRAGNNQLRPWRA